MKKIIFSVITLVLILTSCWKEELKIEFNDIFVSIQENDMDIFIEWKPLIWDDKPLYYTILWDAIFQKDDGSIYFLSLERLTYEKIAYDLDWFEKKFFTDKFYNLYFPSNFKEYHNKELKEISYWKTLSYLVPTFLWWKKEPNNFHVSDISVHFSIIWQIYNKSKDLPTWAPLNFELK